MAEVGTEIVAKWIEKIEMETNIFAQNIKNVEFNILNVNESLEETGKKAEKVSQSGNKINSIFNEVSGAIKKIDVQKILSTSGEFVQTTAKLNIMNDGLMTTEELTQKIYASAKNARGSFSGMTDFVTQMGTQSGDSFGSTEEIVAFGNLLQKQMTIAGASTGEASDMMSKLAQSSESGVLGGNELNDIFKQMPNMVQSVADYLDMPVEKVSELASQGKITTEVLKNAMFASADEINANFEQMPMTWEQIWQSMQDTALNKFQPVLQRINAVANSEPFQALISGVTVSLGIVGNVVASIFDVLGTIAGFVYDNWSLISPVIYSVIAALGIYTLALFANSAMQAINSIQKEIAKVQQYAYAKATLASSKNLDEEKSATLENTIAQASFNTTLLASPITWIIVSIIVLIGLLYLVVAAINKVTGSTYSATGIITGLFAYLAAYIVNTVIVPIWNCFAALANFLGNLFNDPVAAVKVLFYDMVLTVIGYILNMASAIEDVINKIPGVKIDITSGLDNFYARLEKAQQDAKDQSDWTEYVKKMDYVDADAWGNAGYNFGSNLGDKASSIFGGLEDVSSILDELALNPEESGIGLDSDSENLSRIADDTSDISNSLDISNENLKYLRDIAERDAVNRFTTSEIKVDMTNHNNISSNMDLDGIINHVVTGVKDAMIQTAEGVNSYGI